MRDVKKPDVIIIGGSPAGSTVSTLIAPKGFRFERKARRWVREGP